MGGVLVQEGERRGEGEIGLLGLDVGAAPAIRGLFHPSLCETVVAAGNVWERKRVTLSLSLSLSLPTRFGKRGTYRDCEPLYRCKGVCVDVNEARFHGNGDAGERCL